MAQWAAAFFQAGDWRLVWALAPINRDRRPVELYLPLFFPSFLQKLLLFATMVPTLQAIKTRVKEQRAAMKMARKKARRAGPSSHRAPSSSWSLPSFGGERVHQFESIALGVRAHCIREFRISMEFEKEATDIAATAFILAFEDCKIHLWWIMPHLDLYGLQSGIATRR